MGMSVAISDGSLEGRYSASVRVARRRRCPSRSATANLKARALSTAELDKI